MTFEQFEREHWHAIEQAVETMENGLAAKPIARYFDQLKTLNHSTPVRVIVAGTDKTKCEQAADLLKHRFDDQDTNPEVDARSVARKPAVTITFWDLSNVHSSIEETELEHSEFDVLILANIDENAECFLNQKTQLQSVAARSSVVWSIDLQTLGSNDYGQAEFDSKRFSDTGVPKVDNSLANNLDSHRSATKLLSGLELVQRLSQGKSKKAAVKIYDLNRQLAELDERKAESSLRDSFDAMRRYIDDKATEIESILSEETRKRQLPNNPYYNQYKNAIDDISEFDFIEERIGKKRRLFVKPEFVNRLKSMLGCDLRSFVEKDCAVLLEWYSRLEQRLKGNFPIKVRTANMGRSFDAKQHLQAANEFIHVEDDYHIDLQSKNFFDRLSHGRRPVFSMMMIASIVGAGIGLSSQFRAVLAPVMLAVFVGATTWTFYSFRNETQEKLSDELLRLRKSLASGILRAYEQTIREWNIRLLENLRKSIKELQRQIEIEFQNQSERLHQQYKSKRRELQNLINKATDESRNLNAIEAPIKKARFAVESWIQSLLRSIRQ